MSETRRQLKERLQAAGLWQDYLAQREQLAQHGLTARQAREEALRQIDSRSPQQPEPSTDRPSNDSPVEEEYRPPPLCRRCERVFAQPACPDCHRNWGTVEAMRAVGFLAEAKRLADWIERVERRARANCQAALAEGHG
jgi:hypothetical protein